MTALASGGLVSHATHRFGQTHHLSLANGSGARAGRNRDANSSLPKQFGECHFIRIVFATAVKLLYG